MNDREKWQERVRDIRAGGTTWWWSWLRINLFFNIFPPHCRIFHDLLSYIYVYIYRYYSVQLNRSFGSFSRLGGVFWEINDFSEFFFSEYKLYVFLTQFIPKYFLSHISHIGYKWKILCLFISSNFLLPQLPS